MKKLVAIFASLFVSVAAIAQTSSEPNIGFENGNYNNWIVSNGSATVRTTWSPDGQGAQVTTGVTNYSPGGGLTWTIKPFGSYMLAIQPGGASPTFDSAAAALGLNTTEVSNIKSFLSFQSQNGGGGDPTPTNASWAKRSVYLEAGKTYTYAWQYLSTDYTPWNDGSMISLTGGPGQVTLNGEQKNYSLLGFTNPGTGNYATGSYGATGWQLAVFTVTVSGQYTLGFSAFNLGDTALSPILFIDEIQGSTTKNGQDFGPIAPNPGSTAPTTPTGPTYTSNITPAQQANINTWLGRNNSAAGVFIEQVGNSNNITVNQIGNKNNYVKHVGAGSGSTVSYSQSTTANTGDGQYLESKVFGNNHNINVQQSGTSGKKSFLEVSLGSSQAAVTVVQSGTGAHYLDFIAAGSGHSANITQNGSAQHKSTINVTNAGGASNIIVNQDGATGKVFSVTQTCTTPAGCSVSINQNQ